MDFNLKKFGAKKHNDNKRYKEKYRNSAKSVQKANSTQKTPTKISKLPSNWDKYEENPESDIVENSSTFGKVAIDFNLIPAGISEFNQFQFKQEKAFAPPNEATELNSSQYFELDLNLINLGLKTLPFYEYVGINKDSLNDSVIAMMDKTASKGASVYQSYLSKTATQQNNEKPASEDNLHGLQEHKELDIITSSSDLNLQEPDLITQELEEWLDNIL